MLKKNSKGSCLRTAIWVGISGWVLFFQVSLGGCAGMDEMGFGPPPGEAFPERLNAVYFIDASQGWIVGSNGTILHTRNGGATWTAQLSGTAQDLSDVRFSDPNTGWAVGKNGTILSTITGGLGWVKQNSGTQDHLNSIFFRSGDTNIGWVVGNSGTILNTPNGGLSWIGQTAGGRGDLNDVFFSDSVNGWTVGDGGLILRTQAGSGGSLWEMQISGTGRNLLSIQQVGSEVWAAGEGGVILTASAKSLGGTLIWTPRPNPGGLGVLTDLFFYDPSVGWISGDSGQILQTTDGGKLWIPRFTRTDATLRALFFINDRTGWAVGDNGTILYTVDGGIFWIRQYKR